MLTPNLRVKFHRNVSHLLFTNFVLGGSCAQKSKTCLTNNCLDFAVIFAHEGGRVLKENAKGIKCQRQRPYENSR